MPASSDDLNDEVPNVHLLDTRTHVLQDAFILDIDNIQAHGDHIHEQ